MPDAVRLPAVERREIDRQSFGREVRDEPQHLRERVLTSRVSSAGQVRAVAENRVDHPHARIARPNFDKHPHTVAVRRLDHGRHVDRLHEAGRDRIGAEPLGRLVAFAPRGAINRHALWCSHVERVQLAVRHLNGLPDENLRDPLSGNAVLSGVPVRLEPDYV